MSWTNDEDWGTNEHQERQLELAEEMKRGYWDPKDDGDDDRFVGPDPIGGETGGSY